MEIETKYQLAKLDPPEIKDSDAIASEAVVDVVPQVEQSVEPVVVDQILTPIAEEPTVRKRGRKKSGPTGRRRSGGEATKDQETKNS